MGLEPKRRTSALWLGTGVHYALQHHYIPGRSRGALPQATFLKWADNWEAEHADEVSDMDEEERMSLKQDIATGYAILEHYYEYCHEWDDFEVLASEQPFLVPVRDPDGNQLHVRWKYPLPAGGWEVVARPVFHGGRWDTVVKDRQGRVWIMDHKTAEKKPDERKLLNDDQISTYLWGALYGGYENVGGFIYNVLRKKTPMVPDAVYVGTKREGLTRAAKSLGATTEKLYREAIKAKGYNIDDYADELGHLQRVGTSEFFERHLVERSRAEIKETGLRIYLECLDMFDPEVRIYPNPTFACPWCPFLSPCLAMSDGADWRGILDANYRLRESVEEGDTEWLPA